MMVDKKHSAQDINLQSPSVNTISIPKVSPDHNKTMNSNISNNMNHLYQPHTVQEGQYKRVDIDFLLTN
jgi:hypothetical protein